MKSSEIQRYKSWLHTLTDDEFENERFTVLNEWEMIGMNEIEASEKTNLCDGEAMRRSFIPKVGVTSDAQIPASA